VTNTQSAGTSQPVKWLFSDLQTSWEAPAIALLVIFFAKYLFPVSKSYTKMSKSLCHIKVYPLINQIFHSDIEKREANYHPYLNPHPGLSHHTFS